MINNAIFATCFGVFAAYPGQAPFGSMPYAGIEVNDVVMAIGVAGPDSNWFYNMNIGVIGHRSALKVVNNKFTMVQTDTAITAPDAWDGAAVASLGNQSDGIAGKLTVRSVSSGAWSIEDCQTGVYTDYSQLDVKSVDMTGMQTGVASRHCTDMLTSQVDGCKIEARLFGIDWRLNAGSGGMRASGNFIYNSGINSVGIWMREANLSGESVYQISGNYVEVVDGLAGISGMRLYGADINWNVVRLTGTPAVDMHGIGVQANDSSLISCNVVTGDDDGDTLKTAYLVNISDRTQVTCNTADSTGKGYAFGGIAPSLFKGNVMKQHFVGLYLNNVAVIDTQTHAGNRWVGSYGSGYGAVNLNAASFTELAKSLFIVDPGMGSTYTPVTPPNDTLPPFYVDNTGWFDIGSGTTFDCNSAYYCIASSVGGGSDELRMSIVSDDTLTVEYIPESKTMARQYLYQELKTDSVLLDSKTEYQSFVSSHENQNIGYLYDVKKSLADVFRLNQTEKQGLASIDSLIKFYTDSILITDSLAWADTATSYTSLSSILSAQLKLQIILRADLLQSRWANITALLTTAQFKNSLIGGGDDPVSNEKMVNTISMQYQLYGKSGMVTYYSTLLGIANQCPFKGGKAVYLARALVSLITDSITYDDQSICLTEGIYRSNLDKPLIQEIIPEIVILPNPANNQVLITLIGIKIGVCNIDLYNSTGELIARKQFNCLDKTNRLDISKLSPGLYMINVNANGKIIANEKLIIHMGVPWLILLLLFAPLNILGQGINRTWFLGTDTGFPMGKIDFNSNSYQLTQQQHKMTFKGTQATISNAQGDFLMSSNGVWIANANNDTMMNGAGLNPGYFVNNWDNGLPIINGNVFLPHPGDTNKYILFHQTELDPNSTYQGIFKSIINITLDSGLGAVIQKNDTIVLDSLSWGIAACRHANGRDWWVVFLQDQSDSIYKVLLTDFGIQSITIESLNYFPFQLSNGSQLTFSPDGTKFITTTYDNPVDRNSYLVISDFDRCSGIFSSTQTLQLTGGSYLWGLAFAPSGDFVYACTSNHIYQVEVSSLSVDTVAYYDGFCYPNPPWCTTFWNMYLAANGKIYITSGNAVQHIHEMNYPDSLGVACDIQQHVINLNGIWYFRSVPNHPNYYLGALAGSPCDTLGMGMSELGHDFRLSVSPNPSNGEFKIMYLLPQNTKGRLEVFDVNGRKVYEMNLPPWSTMQWVNLPERIASGVYNLKISGGGCLVNKKLVLVQDQ